MRLKPLASLPGLILVVGLLAVAMFIANVTDLSRHGIGAGALGIVLGVIIGNLFPRLAESKLQAGIGFAQTRLLRWGIVLFGFHLSLQQILTIGRAGVLIDIVMIVSTLALGLWIGKRYMGLDTQTALLTGVGSAICGAAAIAATAPYLNAKTEKTTAAIGTVVLFGTLGMLVYPMINEWGPAALHPVFGTYVGSTVHEVAQVVAIGSGLGSEIERNAIVVKMLRVLMLMPFLLALGARQRAEATGHRLQHMPWFALGFVAAAAINSLDWLSASHIKELQNLGALLLAAAMIALGLGTTWAKIRRAGVKPVLLGGLLFVHLVVFGALSNQWIAQHA